MFVLKKKIEEKYVNFVYFSLPQFNLSPSYQSKINSFRTSETAQLVKGLLLSLMTRVYAQELQGGRKKPTPESCSVTSSALWHRHTDTPPK